MILKIFFTLVFVLSSSLAWSLQTAITVKMKDGTFAEIRPITADPKDKKAITTILKDKDTCRFMRDGTPWPDALIEGQFSYYVENWKVFRDLQSMGIPLESERLSFPFLIVKRDGAIIGNGGIQKSSRSGSYDEVYFSLLPPYRNKGLGTQLGKFLIKFYQSVYGKKTMEATVLPDNKPSQALLKKLGFVPLLDHRGKQISHAFPKYGGRVYDVYRYTPAN